ncbi:carboxypeptidase regulatory-like domain-containing protein [Streptomyces sp. NPDC097727]|uniref:carboxypeptidase regulatory-like domain-containing protein n=1 Tax=Streptomyces sp. NPDC097727 TaxID=3366092 RepID=UPI0038230F52
MGDTQLTVTGISRPAARRRRSVWTGLTALASASAIAVLGLTAPAANAATSDTTTKPSVEASCSRPGPGEVSCFSLRRTDVTSTKGVQPSDTTPSGWGATALQDAYNLPADGGAGQTIAIVDAYDDPTAEEDLAVYRAQYGLPACTTANGCFKKVDQRGGTDYPAPDSGWAGEISLDLDMVSAAAPYADIVLVEADSASFEDIGASVDQAVAQGVKFISDSYGTGYTSTPGSGEDPSETTEFDAHYNHPGVAVVASSGDDAYPAASQYVTSVGGTALAQDSSTSRGWSESVWHNSYGGPGSGCSVYEAKPAWQEGVGTDCDMRAVSDVSAVADPLTGVSVYQTYGGDGWAVYGGTSASSPIIAGAYAAAGTPTAGTNVGYAYDPAAGTWSSLPNVDVATFRDGGAPGFYKVGGATGTASPVSTVELLPGYDQTGGSDVSWLSLDSSEFKLAPGATVSVAVSVKASVDEITQPGEFTAQVAISTNTSYAVASVPVTMTVAPPNTWGKITGTVLGKASDGSTAPLKGATVQVDSWASSYTLITDKDGHYALWLDARNNPLTVIVAKDGYAPTVTTVQVVKKGTVTTDFTLKKAWVRRARPAGPAAHRVSPGPCSLW